MQVLRDDPDWTGWLIKKEINPVNIFAAQGEMYLPEVLAISHAWQAKEHPDKEGRQMAQVHAYVNEHREIEHVCASWRDDMNPLLLAPCCLLEG